MSAGAPEIPGGASAVKSGWLKKRSPGGFLGISIWQSRYVVVDEDAGTLKYFRSVEDSQTDNPGAGR